jgi:hypothetical protein
LLGSHEFSVDTTGSRPVTLSAIIHIEVTPEIEQAAKFSNQPVRDFCLDWIRAGVEACEDDYITHDGEVIGDECEIEELENETLFD